MWSGHACPECKCVCVMHQPTADDCRARPPGMSSLQEARASACPSERGGPWIRCYSCKEDFCPAGRTGRPAHSHANYFCGVLSNTSEHSLWSNHFVKHLTQITSIIIITPCIKAETDYSYFTTEGSGAQGS